MTTIASKIEEGKLGKKVFSTPDSGATHRLITYWEEKDILLEKNKEGKWRRYTLKELVWIQIIIELRRFNIGLETIKEIKKEISNAAKVNDKLSAGYISINSFDDLTFHLINGSSLLLIFSINKKGKPQKDLKWELKFVDTEKLPSDFRSELYTSSILIFLPILYNSMINKIEK